MSTLAALALASGLACALAPLAQAARIAATGSARDVSLIWLSLYAVGSVVWLVYGTAIGSLPLIVSQATALTCIAVTLALAGRYRNDHRRSGGARHRARGAMDIPEPDDLQHSAALRSAAGASTGSKEPVGH